MLDSPDLVAITRYSRETYPAFYALAPNGGGMDKTFDEWEALANQRIIEMAYTGTKVIRVDMDIDKFTTWLRRNNVHSTNETRARYALEIAILLTDTK